MVQARWIILVVAYCTVGCGRQDAAAPASAPPTTHASPPASTAPAESFPVVLIDAHHAMRRSDATGTPYLHHAGSGLILDARNIVLHDPDGEGRRPNIVRILYDRSEYAVPWPARGTTTCQIDLSTVKLVKGSPFTGFEKAKRAAIGIGFESTDSKTNETTFREFWAGWIIFN